MKMTDPEAVFVLSGYPDEPESTEAVFTFTDGFGETAQMIFSTPLEIGCLLALLDDALGDMLLAHEKGIEAVAEYKGRKQENKPLIDASELDVSNLESLLDFDNAIPDNEEPS